MNWFQRFFTNPNVHALAAAAAPVLMTAFPQYAIAIGAAGTLAGVVSAATPENPVLVPTPVAAPLPAAPALAVTGSMHQADYAALAERFLDELVAARTPPAAKT